MATQSDYELHEVIGRGALSEVFRATQRGIDRDVAVKRIRPELASLPGFVDRFEAEAQLIARIEHPFVVPLYDYWSDDDGAHVVMRWLRRGSLTERLEHGPLSLTACGRLVRQVGGALEAVHEAGVVHRDIKPANVFLDDDSNFYLGDFGIARGGSDGGPGSPSGLSGSPAYAAPEQLRGDDVASPADVYAFGITLYQALVGQVPFPDTRRREDLIDKQLNEPLPSVRRLRLDLPAAVDELLARMTEKDPTARPAGMDEVIAEWAAIEAEARPRVPAGIDTLTDQTVGANPYRGLEPFRAEDAARFFGRDRLIAELVDALAAGAGLLAVVGASGSGKSSAVRAGLVPALAAGVIEGSADWVVRIVVPGDDPLATVEGAAVDLVAENATGLLVIDQFEEVFVHSDEREVGAVLGQLAEAVTRSDVKVVVTLRADFYDRPLAHPDFAALMKPATVAVTPMAPGDIEAAIVEPAWQAGGELEAGLLSQLVADLSTAPGALPLLQFTLTELWDRQASGVLTMKAYDELGGVAGAVARTADRVFDDLDPDGQEAARRLFTRLVSISPDRDDTKQRLPLARSATPAANEVVEAFTSARLLSVDREETGSTIELAHEALIHSWPRLRAWLDEDREVLVAHRRLATGAELWHGESTSGSVGGSAGLLSGSQLAALDGWLPGREDTLSEIERQFVSASTESHEQREAAEARQRSRRLRTAVAVAVVATALAATASLFFVRARQAEDRADDQAERATALALASQSLLSNEENPGLALALASQAVMLDPQPTAVEALFSSRMAFGGRSGQPIGEPIPAHVGRSDDVAVSPDGTLIATASADGLVQLWDAATGDARELELTGHQGVVESVAFSPDGSRLVSAADDGTVRIWELEKSDTVGLALTGHTEFVWRAEFSPDGSRIVSASDDGTVRFWDAVTGEPIGEPLTGHDGGLLDVTYHPSGTMVASAGRDGTVRLWDAVTGEPIGEPLVGHEALVLAVDFSPDGDRIVSAGGDGTARVWDTATGQQTGEPFTGHVTNRAVWVFDAAFSPDGRTVASGASDSTIRLWDAGSGAEVGSPLISEAGSILGLAFSADGSQLVSSHFDGSVQRWNPQPGEAADAALGPFESPPTAILERQSSASAGDQGAVDGGGPGLRFVVGHADGTIRAFGSSGELWSSLGHSGSVTGLAELDGRLISASGDGTVRWWGDDGASGRPEDAHVGAVAGVVVDAAAGLVFTAGADGRVMAWSADLEPRGAGFDPGVGPLSSIALVEPGRLVVGSESGAVSWLAVGDGARLEADGGRESQPTAHDAPVTSLAVSPDGAMVASTSDDLTVRLWATSSGGPLGEALLGHTDYVWAAAFSPDGHFLATGGRDGTVRLWDVADGEPYGPPLASPDAIMAASFTGTGTGLVAASRSGVVHVWDALWDATTGCELAADYVPASQLAPFYPDGLSPRPCR